MTEPLIEAVEVFLTQENVYGAMGVTTEKLKVRLENHDADTILTLSTRGWSMVESYTFSDMIQRIRNRFYPDEPRALL